MNSLPIRNFLLCTVAAVAAFSTGPTHAADTGSPISGEPHPLQGAPTFLRAHDDLRFRRDALESIKDGLFDAAVSQLELASRFADKPSQALLGEMYWRGFGVPEDKARAYAWMDLAAERGYRQLVALREHYWENLKPHEQVQALEIGKDLYAEYGDKVAKPRMDRRLTQARRERTGSRIGAAPMQMRVYARSEQGDLINVNGEEFHDARYWSPRLYHAWKDANFELTFHGDVDVGELETERRRDGEASPPVNE